MPGKFARLAWSNLVAQLSEQMALAAAPLVAVLFLGATASETGFLQTAQTLPFLILSLPAGVLADRTSRRALMVRSEALRAVSLASLICLVGSGLLSLTMLGALGFVGAIGTVCYTVCAPALVPNIVSREQLARANRWLELARSTAFTAGPALGGTIVGWIGAPALYVLATALSLFAVVLLSGLHEKTEQPETRRHFVREVWRGAAFVFTQEHLRPILVTAVFFNTSWFILQAVYVAYAIHELEMAPATVGITVGMYGCGMMAGALVAPLLARFLPFGAMIAAGPTSALAAAIIILSTIRFPFSVSAGISFFLFGAGPIVWTITTTTLRQSVTPNAMLARVSALIMTATFGARPIGAAIGALVAARSGADAAIAVAVVGFIIQFIVLFASPVPRLAHLPEAAQLEARR